MNFPGSASIFHYRPACVLRVSGTDAWSFLQGQFTNDLQNVSPGRAVYGLWLHHKGCVMGDSEVDGAAAGPAYWVVSLSSPASAVARRLEDHVVADDVV